MKKMIVITVLVLIGMLAKLTLDIMFKRSIACVTVKVINDQGIPISGATANLTLRLPKSNNPWDGMKYHYKKGKTNSKGECTLIGKGLDEVSAYASKYGYYDNASKYKFENKIWIFKRPWNHTIEVVLRKKINPIPLKAKEMANFKLVNTSTFYKYDLFIGDWLEPYGKGKVADLNINFNYTKMDRCNYIWSCIISTVSEDDGFRYIDNSELTRNSKFKLPYNAFDKGYTMTNLVYNIEHVAGQSTSESIEPLFNNLFFRIRTEKDGTGTILKCYYGKLTRLDCQFISTLCEGRLSFTYYLNPTPNDRNLEFNTESNLFKNLKWSEKVSKP
jgi:hypothetical protein